MEALLEALKKRKLKGLEGMDKPSVEIEIEGKTPDEEHEDEAQAQDISLIEKMMSGEKPEEDMAEKADIEQEVRDFMLKNTREEDMADGNGKPKTLAQRVRLSMLKK